MFVAFFTFKRDFAHLDGVAERHDHGERVPPLPRERLPLERRAVLAVLPKDHHVLRERARLVAEEVRHQAQLLVDVGGVAPMGYEHMNICSLHGGGVKNRPILRAHSD